MAHGFGFLIDRLFHRDHLDREMNEEISLHIATRAEELERLGISKAEALRRARIEFGGLEKCKEQCRETRRFHLLHDFVIDLRLATRLMRKSPGFTAVVLLTLTLGVGANTAMFSLLDALVFRQLPVPQPAQLVHFGVASFNVSYSALSLPMFEEISRRQTVFSSTFMWWGDAVMNVEANSVLVRSAVYAVDGNYFSELGAKAELGRLIGRNDVQLNQSPSAVAVLGHAFWEKNYGGDPDIIGKNLRVEGVPFAIVGVLRQGFSGTSAELEPEVTVPITAEPLINGYPDWQKHLQRSTALWLDAAGRLKPGTTLTQARAQLEGLWSTVRQDMINSSDTPAEASTLGEMRMRVESLATGEDSIIRGRFRQPVVILVAISGILLLLACANLAGLMLARASVRRHELGIRASLGASRGRLAQQMLAESLSLSLLGTCAGFVCAIWASRAVAKFVLGAIFYVPAALRLTPDVRMLSFTACVAIATGVVFGFAPAWAATHQDPQQALQNGLRTLGQSTGLLGKSLVVGQISLALVLVTAAGLFVRSLEKLRLVQPGFRADGVLKIDLVPRPNIGQDFPWTNYFRDLTDRIAQMPGTQSAGAVHQEIGNLFEWVEKVREHGARGEARDVDCEMIMPGFFKTLEIKVLRGRDFTWHDDVHSLRTAIVSENFSQMLFSMKDSVGRRVDVPVEGKIQNVEIVGVVSDATLYDIRKHAPPTIYLPAPQYPDYMPWNAMLIRTSLPPVAAISSVRAIVNSLGHHYIFSVGTLSDDLERSILQERLTGALSTFFGGLSMLLAVIGLYGLLTYNVTRRTREIGIRVTLGARRGEIRGMILSETVALLFAGCAIGLLFALGASQLIAHMLFGISAHDPATMAFTIAVLSAAGLMAAIVPAWRAMRVDPVVALRCE